MSSLLFFLLNNIISNLKKMLHQISLEYNFTTVYYQTCVKTSEI